MPSETPQARERTLIDAIAARLPKGRSQVLVGTGDDTSVVVAEPICLTSVDAIVQDVHFKLGQGAFSHFDVGAKALGSALSDLAAMGADPGQAHLVLCAERGLRQQDALAIVDGAASVAQATGVSIVGGDVVTARQLIVAVTVTGWAQSPQLVVQRSGARPGDRIGVTGALGGAGVGLALIEGEVDLHQSAAAAALARAKRPAPRLREGKILAGSGASAMIDISDGLATDAMHIGLASKAILKIDLAALPLDNGVSAAAKQLQTEPWRLAACAGEDYELCACVPAAMQARVEAALASAGLQPITWIGEVIDAGADTSEAQTPGARFELDGRQISLEGFQHRW